MTEKIKLKKSKKINLMIIFVLSIGICALLLNAIQILYIGRSTAESVADSYEYDMVKTNTADAEVFGNKLEGCI